MRIGITIGLRDPKESMWVNGIKQTAIFLAKLLRSSPHRHKVTLVNTTQVPITRDLPWDLHLYPALQYPHIKDDLDVLFVLGGAIGQSWLDELKSRGTKVVSFRCGSEYFVSMERIIFNQSVDVPPGHITGFDQMWFIPQVWEANRHYLQVLHRLENEQMKQVPFVWDSMFIKEYLDQYPNRGEYRPRSGARRLSCFEPNINVLKNFIYPLLMAEKVYRKTPDAIEFVSILGTQYFRQNTEFLGVVGHLDIVRDKGKCYFEDRHPTPWFLANHTDIVISHQILNPLNNLTLEVGWLGYPLVHNSELCRNIGYYFEGFDIGHGAELLSEAIHSHDEQWEAYRDRNRDAIQRYLPTNPALIEAYDNLLEGLFA